MFGAPSKSWTLYLFLLFLLGVSGCYTAIYYYRYPNKYPPRDPFEKPVIRLTDPPGVIEPKPFVEIQLSCEPIPPSENRGLKTWNPVLPDRDL